MNDDLMMMMMMMISSEEDAPIDQCHAAVVESLTIVAVTLAPVRMTRRKFGLREGKGPTEVGGSQSTYLPSYLAT